MKRFVLLLASFLVMAGNALAGELAGPTKPYTAEIKMTFTEKGKSHEMTMKLAQSGKKRRQEIMQGGTSSIVISRGDLGKNWVLVPDQKMYMETPVGSANPEGKEGHEFMDPQEMKSKGYSMEKAGSETVNGHKATKYKISGKEKDGGAFSGLLWLTDENILVRMEGKNTDSEGSHDIRYDAVKLEIGKVSDALFEIPKGYKKQEMPDMSEMMKGMGMKGDHGRGGHEGMPSQGDMEAMKKKMEEMQKEMMKRMGQ